MNDRKIISAWTDGACEPNPGMGGWGYLLVMGHKDLLTTGRAPNYEEYGGELKTTSNRMEMTAILQCMHALNHYDNIFATIYTDSMYCVNGVNSWSQGWKSKGWYRKGGQHLMNRDLWILIDEAKSKIDGRVHLEWVKGHNGDIGNECADHLAGLGRQWAIENQ
jgi:ribonuclease HI